MDLSAISALKLMNPGELTDLTRVRTVSSTYRLQAAQVLACDYDDFEYSEELQEAVTLALSDLIKELAGTFDGDAQYNEALIAHNLVKHYFERREDVFRPYSKNWPNEEESLRKTWRWPVVQLPDGPGKTKLGPFPNQYSALKMFGYTVGKTQGWPRERRHSFLSDFMSMDLPGIVEKTFGSEYGTPLSVKRLRKVADLIAALCSLAHRRDPVANKTAISDWRDDLEFLRDKFYEGQGLKFVPWPQLAT